MPLRYLNNVATLPQFYITYQQDDMPLGSYGCALLKQMQDNYPERYWQLSFDGTLMTYLREREKELMDLKMQLMDSIEKKFPRPKTDDFLTIAAHMDLIDEQAELVVSRELYKPI